MTGLSKEDTVRASGLQSASIWLPLGSYQDLHRARTPLRDLCSNGSIVASRVLRSPTVPRPHDGPQAQIYINTHIPWPHQPKIGTAKIGSECKEKDFNR